jgi:hypothetical protein
MPCARGASGRTAPVHPAVLLPALRTLRREDPGSSRWRRDRVHPAGRLRRLGRAPRLGRWLVPPGGAVMELAYTNYSNVDARLGRRYERGARLVSVHRGTIDVEGVEPTEAIAERLFARHNADGRPDGQDCPVDVGRRPAHARIAEAQSEPKGPGRRCFGGRTAASGGLAILGVCDLRGLLMFRPLG